MPAGWDGLLSRLVIAGRRPSSQQHDLEKKLVYVLYLSLGSFVAMNDNSLTGLKVVRGDCSPCRVMPLGAAVKTEVSSFSYGALLPPTGRTVRFQSVLLFMLCMMIFLNNFFNFFVLKKHHKLQNGNYQINILLYYIMQHYFKQPHGLL